jgi:dihydrofolate reductase
MEKILVRDGRRFAIENFNGADWRISRDSKFFVKNFGLGTSSPVFLGRKTWLRCSILHESRAGDFLRPYKKPLSGLILCGRGESNSRLNLGKVVFYH